MSKRIIEQQRSINLFKKLFPLTNYMESNCIYADGSNIRRSEVIKYIANKKGGKHFDSKRNPSQEKSYIVLDSFSAKLKLTEKPVCYYGLLEIGQSVANAQDTAKFTEILGCVVTCIVTKAPTTLSYSLKSSAATSFPV